MVFRVPSNPLTFYDSVIKLSHHGQRVTETECLNHPSVLAFFFTKAPGCVIAASWNPLTWLSTQMLCSVEQDTIWRERLELHFNMGLVTDIKGCKWHPRWFIISKWCITYGNIWKMQEEMSSERYFERTALLWNQLFCMVFK